MYCGKRKRLAPPCASLLNHAQAQWVTQGPKGRDRGLVLPRDPRSAAVTWDGRTKADIRSDMPKAKRTIRLAILDSAHDDAYLSVQK